MFVANKVCTKSKHKHSSAKELFFPSRLFLITRYKQSLVFKPCAFSQSKHKCSPGSCRWSSRCRRHLQCPSGGGRFPVIRRRAVPDASRGASTPLSLFGRMARFSRCVRVGAEHGLERVYASVCTQTTPLQQRDDVRCAGQGCTGFASRHSFTPCQNRQ